MKLLMLHDSRVYAGDRISIVEKFRARAKGFMETKDLGDYIDQVSSKYGFDTLFPGNTIEERCEAFIEHLVSTGLAEIIDG